MSLFANADIDIGDTRIHQPDGGINTHTDIRMRLIEPLQPPDQPFAGKDRRNRYGQPVFITVFRQADCCGQFTHAACQMTQDALAKIRQNKAFGTALEKPAPKLEFGFLNLLADGADGHADVFGCETQASKPPDRLNRTQTTQTDPVEISHIA